MRQTWTSDDGRTFDTEEECDSYEGGQREFLQYIIGYLLREIERCGGYPKEAQEILRSIGVEKLARNILHLENFCGLVAEIRNDKDSEGTYFEVKSYSPDGKGEIWPEGVWFEKKMCRDYPLTKTKLP